MRVGGGGAACGVDSLWLLPLGLARHACLGPGSLRWLAGPLARWRGWPAHLRLAGKCEHTHMHTGPGATLRLLAWP